MPKLIKNKQTVTNDWVILESIDDVDKLKDKKIFISIDLWADLPSSLSEKLAKNELGIFIDSHQSTEELPEDFQKASAIAINFPAFTDGRGYTIARELRNLKHYQGEIRAVGDVLHDQLNAMLRCGFDAFELVDDKDEKKALKAFNDFSQKYQSDLLDNRPIYQR